MTTRFTFVALIIAVALVGCGKKKAQPAQVEETPEERRAANEAGFRKYVPVLDRTMVMTDLDQIHLYFYTAYSASGKWPKDMSEAKETMKRDHDMRKLLAKIEDGTYVIVGNPPEGGILAYCTKETTVGFITVRTNKEFDQYKQEELQKQLAAQRH
jgi:hypothetical protein